MNLAEEEVVFYQQIGRALSQWAYVESQLERIVMQAVPISSQHAVGAAYGSIETFFGKIRFCNTLVLATYGDCPHVGRWERAHEAAQSLAKKRNSIAHGLKHVYVNATVGRRYALVDVRPTGGSKPHVYGEKPPSGALCLSDIAMIAEDFHAITTDLCNVHELLGGRREPFPDAGARTATRPTLRDLRNQVRRAVGAAIRPARSK